MEPGESSYSAERRRFPVAFLAGAIVVALLFGGFYLLTRIRRLARPCDSRKTSLRRRGTGLRRAHPLRRPAHGALHQHDQAGIHLRNRNHVQRRRPHHSRHGSHRGISRRAQPNHPARFPICDRAQLRPAAQCRPEPRIPSHSRTCSRGVESRVSFLTSYWPGIAIAAPRFSTRQRIPMAVCR